MIAFAGKTFATPPMQFPDAAWLTATPASQGIDPSSLRQALGFLQLHCKSDGLSEVMVIRNGFVVWQGDQTHKVHNVWSCSKSFTSTALGLLIDEGKCRLDTKVASVLPDLKTLYPDANLRHFTTMTSGYSGIGRSRWDDENSDWSWTPYVPDQPFFVPGTAFAYWDEAQMTLGRALTRIATVPLRDYLQIRLFDPIGLGQVEWSTEGTIDGIAINNGCTNIHINARQMARFCQLFLNRGQWDGVQVVPADWVKAATQN
ncbi:MAG: serine hydrolase [Planctomycetota bacterium]